MSEDNGSFAIGFNRSWRRSGPPNPAGTGNILLVVGVVEDEFTGQTRPVFASSVLWRGRWELKHLKVVLDKTSNHTNLTWAGALFQT